MSKPVPFSHLHVHTEYSLLDGACRVDQLANRVKELGMESIAVTDHGVMTGLYKLQAAANKAGIKPIFGCELYFTEERAVKDPNNRYYHLTALAETTQGLHNLYKMNLRAAQEGMYYGKPRVDYELLKEYGEGVIILSGCLAGRTMQSLANSDLEPDLKKRMHGARDELIRLQDCVGKENVYVEVQNSGVKDWDGSQWEWNAQLQTLANDLGLLTVGTSDTHYLTADMAKGPREGDPWYHDTLLCVQTRALKDQPLDKRMSLIHDWNNPHYYHLRNIEEMKKDLENVPESIPNTLIVAERCNAEIKTGRTFEMLPDFPVPEDYKTPAGQPDGMDEKIWRQQSFLREKIWEGLHRRYGSPLPAEVVERAEYELEVINKMGTTSYFLITWDWIRYAKEIGMVIGPGRGCFVPETRIWTPEGYKQIADMQAGDTILDENGQLGQVRKQFEYQVDEEMVYIKHHYGDEAGLTVTVDHKILVEPGALDESGEWAMPTGKTQWMPARDIQPGDLVAVAMPNLEGSKQYLGNKVMEITGMSQQELLDGLTHGDRTLRTHHTELAYCVRTLLWAEGVPSSLSLGQDGCYHVTRGDLGQDGYGVGARCGDYMMLRVTEAGRIHYQGPVYDLAIEDPNPPSYTTSSCIVHNSGAGSIVLYALDVTQLCPLEHKLLFERFLSPDRISMPDVDTDAAPVGEANYDMVRQYLREKYGEENCAQIITFQTIGGKAGIRAAARAFGPELLPLADRLAKAVPMDGAVPVPLTQALEEGVEFKQALAGGGTEAQKIIDNALWMEGLISAESVHAAAFVISPIPLTDALPIQLNKDGHPVTAFAMGEAESVGCLKLDLLGLRNLSILADAQRLIKKYQDVDVDAVNYQVPMDDAKTFEMLARGESVGVFQFESGGMQDTLRAIGTTEFNDLVAIVAAYRPGAMDQIPLYARRKKGLEPVTYGDERMREILHETYGLCLTGDSLLTDARTGAQIRLDDAVADRTPILVQGVDEKHQPQLAEVTDYFDNGMKPVYKVTLRNGSALTMTREHRLLTEAGWEELGDLSVGNYVACPKEIIRNSPSTNWSKDRIRTLAYLLGDGAISNQSLVSFYSSDKDLLRTFKTAVTREFPDVAVKPHDRPRGVTMLSVSRKERKAGPNYHDASTILSWLRELGLKNQKGGCRSEHKFIPDEVFQMPQEDIAFFLASLWDCDGHVGSGTSFYKTISPRLAHGIRTLLLMLGIPNSIYTHEYENESGSTQTAHQVSIHDGPRFAKIIQPHMAHKAKRKVDCSHQSRGVTIDRSIYLEEMGAAREQLGLSCQRLTDATGVRVKNHMYISKGYSRIAQSSVAPVLEYLDMPISTKNCANEWSEIISIEEAGKQHVYDITVDKIHSYIANNIYVHNCLYQEQSMLLARDLAGFTGGLMDTLRKAIGKKLMDKMMELKPIFFHGTTVEKDGETIEVPGCIKNGVDKKTAEWVWDVFEASASYSFNKSHAAAYALISYVTAYLKANYPTEYMAALLTSVMHTKDKVPFYLYETKRMGIDVLPPSVNESFSQFEPSGENAIRFGLTAVKGVGEGIVEAIVAAREQDGLFKNLWDFAQRVDGVNRREVDNLIKAGAFDFSGDTRKGMLEASESLLKQAKKTRQKKSEGQDSLFDAMGSAEAELAAMEVSDAPSFSKDEFTETEKFALEREVAGLYVSGHPLEGARAAWERVRHLGVGEINEEHLSDNPDHPNVVTVAGIITAKRAVYTKRDNKRMLIIQLEDLTGTAEIVVFPKLVEEGMEQYLNEGQMAYLRVGIEEDTRGFGSDDDDSSKQIKLIAKLAGPFNPDAIEVPEYYDLQLPHLALNAEMMNTLMETLRRHPGDQSVRLILLDENGEESQTYVFPEEVQVSPSEKLGEELRQAAGLD